MDFIEKVKQLRHTGRTQEEIAHIIGTDVGRVRIVMAGGADPEYDTADYNPLGIFEEEKDGPLGESDPA